MQNELANTTLNATALMCRFVLPHVFFPEFKCRLATCYKRKIPNVAKVPSYWDTIRCITNKRPTTQAIADSIIRGQHLNHVDAVIFSIMSEI